MRTLAVWFCLATALGAVEPGPEQYHGRLVAPSNLTAPAQAAVDDLESYLERLTNVEFTRSAERSDAAIVVARQDETDVPAGAKQALAAKGAQAFVIWPEGARLWLVSASDEGLSHAVSTYLEHLGVRWLAPAERWTIVPRRADVRVSSAIARSPAFVCRSFFGTGGFGGNLPCDPRRSLQATWMTWQRRNRFGGEYAFGGHTGEAFNTVHKKQLEEHPEYLAEIAGQRVPWSLTAKLCGSHPMVQQLFIADRLAALRQQRQLDPYGPRARIVSVEPADGGGHCDCAACRKLGSVSDRVFHLANLVARAVRQEVPDALVNLYAYNEHAAVPSIGVDDNVFVLAVPYGFQRTDMSPEQLLQAWGRKAKHLGVYDYWSIPDWSRDEPDFDFLQRGPNKLRFWQRSGVTAFSSESTFSTGAMGAAWYVSARLAWEPTLDVAQLLGEFYRDAFGPAAGPMQRMLERWSNGFLATSHELALSFRDVDEAWRLAHDQPEYATRVADMGRYVEYLRLHFEHRQSKPRSEQRYQAALQVMSHGWNIYDSTMIHAFRLSQLLARDESMGHAEILQRYDVRNPQAPGWLAIAPLTDDTVRQLVEAGVNRYQPQSYTPRRFHGPLGALDHQRPPSPEFSPEFVPASGPTLQVAADRAGATFVLRVAAEKELRVTVTNPAGETVFQQRVEGRKDWTTAWDELSIALPSASVFKVSIWSPKRTLRLSYSNHLPVSFESWVNSQGRPTPRFYF